MIQILKNINKFHNYILLAALIGGYFFIQSFFNNIYPRIQKLEDENKQLLSKIESNNNKIVELKEKIVEKNEIINHLEYNDKKLNDKYAENNDKLNQLRQKYENLSNIDDFGSDEIINFFAENYK
jgi:SMC interacting uncharacterized protein involved in chromosome segregation